MASAFWEPWQPKFGDAVRCTPSPECQSDWCKRQPFGSTGQVQLLLSDLRQASAPDDLGAADGHTVFVIVSTDAEGRSDGGWYAPIELEPLQRTDAPAAASGGE